MNSIQAEAIKYLVKQGRESKTSTLFIWLLLMSPVLYEDFSSLFVWVNAAAFLGYDFLSFRTHFISDEYYESYAHKSANAYCAIACVYAIHWGLLCGYILFTPEFENIYVATTLLLAFSTTGSITLWMLNKKAGQLFLTALVLPSICVYMYKGGISSYVTALIFILSLLSILKMGDIRAKMFLGVLNERMNSLNAANTYKAISNEDPLTGIHNRRFFDLNFSSMVLAAKKDSKPISLLIVDIDHFKEVNDNFGHDAGDACIKSVAQLLKKETRESDVLSRFGGEEFVVILPGANQASAQTIAERMIYAVRKNVIHYAGEEIKFTISIGATALNSGDYDHKYLFKTADDALYRAKSLGRNRIVFSNLV